MTTLDAVPTDPDTTARETSTVDAPAAESSAAHATVATPTGPFTFVVDDAGAVLASGWTDDAASLLPSIHRALRPASSRWSQELTAVSDAVEAYYAGQLDAIDAVAVRQRSGPYVEKVWESLRAVAPGSPMTFAQLAEAAGHPTAIRATATACARNGATLFVPCHRVLRQDGTVAGSATASRSSNGCSPMRTAGPRRSDHHGP